MKEFTITTKFSIFENILELPTDINNLMAEATKIRKTAYAPYSNFKVGCALLLNNDQIMLGSNQENAAFPSGLCAERVAIFSAGSKYPNSKIMKMAISASSGVNIISTPIPPCGACLQSIAEYEIKQKESIEIYFMAETGFIYKSDSLKNMLPFMFEKNFL